MNCPWTLETEIYDNLLLSLRNLIETVIDSYLTFCMLLVVVGYQIVILNISNYGIKLVLSLTTFKFIVDQLSTALMHITFLIPTLIFTRVVLEIVMFIIMCIYM